MKRCQTCNRTYTEENLSYCIDDGTPLTPIATDDESTVVAAKDSGKDSGSDRQEWNSAPYRPPTVSYVPPGAAPQRRVWPWVVGVLAFGLVAFTGMAVSAWFLLPQFARSRANRNDNVSSTTNRNSSTNPDETANPNSKRDSNSPTTGEDDTLRGNTNTDAPTDKEQVLAELTNLEHEWTVANINADKKKLDVILADDYVSTDERGQMKGKREYLRDIKRDTTIETWHFEDLEVTLRGDRASLTGKIRLRLRGQEALYEFTDKFVWRDGRWQATGSVVNPLTQQ